MIELISLVKMQLKDKIDFSWTKSVKRIIQKIIFGIVEFAVVFGLCYVFLTLGNTLGIFYSSESLRVSIIIISLMFFLSLISCTIGMMDSLYFAEDNKVLVTFPVSGIKLFLSKMIIFYLAELKKAIFFTIPIILSCFIFCKQYISIGTYFWSIIPLLFYIGLPVLLGALLSIPAMFIKRLFMKLPIIQIIVIFAIVGLGIWGIVELIGIIPDDIDIFSNWGIIKNKIRDVLLLCEEKLFIFTEFVHSLTGELTASGVYKINVMSFVKVLILIVSSIVLLALILLIIKPFFFYMMTKSFEFDKRLSNKNKKTKSLPVWLTFIKKEASLKFRESSFYTNYVVIYILTPILLLFINVIFHSMDTDSKGKLFSYFFNFLLITLPLLTSNAKIATEFSKEGRAAYIKKTKPIHMYWALTSKFVFNLVLALCSIIACSIIIEQYTDLTVSNVVTLCFAITLLQYGHMFYSARLDLMNPQNEQYATIGSEINNPNENKSIIVAFILSFLFSIAGLIFFKQSNATTNAYQDGCTRLLILATFISAISIYMYFVCIKAYYLEK